MAHRVDVPKSKQPEFPDCCVSCGLQSPGTSLMIRAAFSTWKPLHEDLFKRWDVEIPCCPVCRDGVRRDRMKAKLLHGAAVLVAVLAILLAVSIWPEATEGWRIYLVIVACIGIPLAIVQALHTPLIELSPWNDRLVFEFRDRGFAEAFAERNGSRVI